MTPSATPTETPAREVVSRYLRGEPFALRRYPTGLCHYVYEVTPANSERIVLRMGRNDTRPQLAGSLYWSERLRALGIPLPRIRHADLAGPFPYTILDHLPGVDLGEVYPSLLPGVRREIASRVADIQVTVRSLPAASGYGFAYSYDDPRLQPSWRDVVLGQLQRAREWIARSAICDTAHVDTLESLLPALSTYLETVRPTPFLHDTTTKNVLVSKSGFVGIVDVDDLCFGDPLFVLALTKMALLAREWDLNYVDYWASSWNIEPSQHQALRFYTALFCVTFMGEIGQAFNKDSVSVDGEQVYRLEAIFNSILKL